MCNNVEYLSICLHFVDERYDIHEEFVAFLKLAKVRATDIADAIVSTLKEFGWFKGNTMSGKKSGS